MRTLAAILILVLAVSVEVMAVSPTLRDAVSTTRMGGDPADKPPLHAIEDITLESPPPMMDGAKTLANGLYMTGQFGYAFSGGVATVTLNGINNDSFTRTSGTLRLELWATTAFPPRGNTNWLGYRLATFASINPMPPRTSYSTILRTANFEAPPGGTYWLILLLEEFNPAVCSAVDSYCVTDTFNSFAQESWGSTTQLSNISTRGQVLTGNDVMIAGFVIQGTPQTVVVRARGPSLVPFGITNAIARPTLQLVRSSDQVTLATNAGWTSAANASQIASSGFAPSNAQEAAILITLPAGAYTAIVSGAAGSVGVGIVEVFTVQ